MFISIVRSHRLLGVAAVLTFCTVPVSMRAQTTAEHIVLGDRSSRAANAASALRHYETAIKADPKSYEALWKATREAVELSEFNNNEGERNRLYTVAELYAHRAVEANPEAAEGHFELARALGRKALSVGKRERVKYASDVHTHAVDALKLAPKHPGALHVMGMWNYNVMRLSGVTRFVARTFLGGKVFDSASWEDAQRYMEESVAAEPNRLVHRLDLARVYAARGNKEKAREQYEATVRGTASGYNDKSYQREAANELKDMR